MKCFDVESRTHLIPLPTVLQPIVTSYLSNDLIPSSIQSILPFHCVVAIDGKHIYCQHNKHIYKNDVAIVHVPSDRLCRLVPLEDDWILIDGALYNIRTKQSKFVTYTSSGVCVIKGKIFYESNFTLYETTATSTSRTRLTNAWVRKLRAVGECLNFEYTTGPLRLHGVPRNWNCLAIYKWQDVIYQIQSNSIQDEDNNIMYAFPHIDAFVDAKAIDEMLFVYMKHHLYIVNLNNKTFMECYETDIRVVNGCLFRVCNDQLIVFH